jgi:two-component system nitrogen regulation response regulator GlnG
MAGQAAWGEDQAYLSDLMGSSSEIRKVFAEVRLVAPTNFTVVVTGESGSGKELVANAVHRLSPRAQGPFVAVDCGSIPPTLIESELFGHEKGAFTGADRSRPGKFEAASGGTLFLDEISNLPFPVQAKLLRVLQEKQVWRVGGVRCTKVDIRVIAATNQDLAALVESGLFRRDLYHRLNEFNITVPPLRERSEDVPFLAKRFLDLANLELGKDIRGTSDAALELLLRHSWPGNARELRNVVRRAVLLASEYVEPVHLGFLAGPDNLVNCADDDAAPMVTGAGLKEIAKQAVARAERDALRQVLLETRGNKAKAARILKVDYKTVHVKVKAYGISI